MKVRFKRDFRGYTQGQVADVTDEAAEAWFAHGIAEPTEKSLDQPPRNKAIKKPDRKKSLTTQD